MAVPRLFGAAIGAISVSLSLVAAASATDSIVLVHPTAGDFVIAKSVTNKYLHAKPAAAHVGDKVTRERLTQHSTASAASAAKGAGEGGGLGLRYPTDLTYHGGAVVTSMVSHPIYLDASGTLPVSTWGNPELFLHDLGKSQFIHLTDGYVGAYGNNRYTVVPGVRSTVPSGTLLVDSDIEALVHAVASATGQTGYGHEYHVFLAPGVDECFDATYSTCYSPDNPPSFYFCAYHSSVDFPDIGHVLYSVEPYQNVAGCSVLPGSPNGELVDSTNSVLSHETFETITDPDGTAWWNSTSNALYGSENGDTCSFIGFTATAAGFDPSIWYSQGHVYATQPELSNALHACAIAPGGE
jgi:hypothetical protein